MNAAEGKECERNAGEDREVKTEKVRLKEASELQVESLNETEEMHILAANV